jgi:3-methylfumaryl-CoA hydratase
MSTLVGLDDLKAHVGRRESADDIVTAAPANLLRLTFGRDEPELGPGDQLPPGWQCLYFLPRSPRRAAATARSTPGIPPMPLPRRMFAGERFRFHRPLRIGETIRRETELADISTKTGGTGTLVFATVVQRIFTADGLAIEEERRTVFREEVRAGERNQAPRRQPAPDDVPWRRRIPPDPVLLFRFSALVQQHRITTIGPGPWSGRATRSGRPVTHLHALIDFARDHTRGRPPTYETRPARLLRHRRLPGRAAARPDGGAVELWAVTPDGRWP